MALTREEREIAAKRAETWAGGASWLEVYGAWIDKAEALSRIHEDPSMIAKG